MGRPGGRPAPHRAKGTGLRTGAVTGPLVSAGRCRAGFSLIGPASPAPHWSVASDLVTVGGPSVDHLSVVGGRRPSIGRSRGSHRRRETPPDTHGRTRAAAGDRRVEGGGAPVHRPFQPRQTFPSPLKPTRGASSSRSEDWPRRGGSPSVTSTRHTSLPDGRTVAVVRLGAVRPPPTYTRQPDAVVN